MDAQAIFCQNNDCLDQTGEVHYVWDVLLLENLVNIKSVAKDMNSP